MYLLIILWEKAVKLFKKHSATVSEYFYR